jgi:hypothetical protein
VVASRPISPPGWEVVLPLPQNPDPGGTGYLFEVSAYAICAVVSSFVSPGELAGFTAAETSRVSALLHAKWGAEH